MPILYRHKYKLHPCNGYKISDKYKKNTQRKETYSHVKIKERTRVVRRTFLKFKGKKPIK